MGIEIDASNCKRETVNLPVRDDFVLRIWLSDAPKIRRSAACFVSVDLRFSVGDLRFGRLPAAPPSPNATRAAAAAKVLQNSHFFDALTRANIPYLCIYFLCTKSLVCHVYVLLAVASTFASSGVWGPTAAKPARLATRDQIA